MNAESLPVLAAEDDESDRFILKLGFARARVPNPLVLVKDGQEAVSYLDGQAPWDDRALHPLPALILLDLKMPRLTAFDVLAWLATRPDLPRVPVVVLSSSSHASDIQRALRMGARDYLVKPNALGDLVTTIQRLHARWLTVSPTDGH